MLLSKMEAPVDARRGAIFAQIFRDAPPELLVSSPPEVPPVQKLREACSYLTSQTSLLIFSLVSSCFLLLLIVRPAFILKFEQDQKRPWRGCTRISWTSVAMSLCAVALFPFLLNFLMIRS